MIGRPLLVQAAGHRDQRVQRCVPPVLADAGANFEAVGDVDLVGGIGAQIGRCEPIVVAGMFASQ